MKSKMASILISLLMVTNIFGAIAQNAGMPNSNSKGTIGLPLSNIKVANSVTDGKGAIMWYGWESRLVCIQLNRDGLSADFTESPLIQENGDPMPTTAFISLTMLEDRSLLWATQEGSTKPFVSKFFHIENPQCDGNTSYAKFLGIMPEDIGIEALYTDALGRIYVMDTGQQHSSSVGNRLLRFTGEVLMGDFSYEVVNGISYFVPDIDGLGPGINKTNGWVVDTPGFAIDSYDLYSVDYETGAFSFIGTTDGPYAIHAINGSYFSDGKSRLYTLTGIPQVGETSSTLYEINPDTGVTLRSLGSGPSGMGLTGSLAPGPGDFPDENKPPVADAGPNQTVNEGNTVKLNGSGSTAGQYFAQNVVALWHMNESSGNVIYDETDNHHDGTIINATWTTDGKFGNALSFDGVDDYVEIKPSDQIFGDNPDEWSYMVWFRTTNEVDNMSVISDYFGKQKIGPGHIHDPNVAIEFYIGHPETVKPHIMVGFYSGGSGSTGGRWDYFRPFSEGNWHFIAVTISKLDEICNVYLDGYIFFDNPLYPDGDFFDGDVLHIGARWELADFTDPNSGHMIYPFDGSIDEVVLFNRALSAQEILDYYNSGQEYIIGDIFVPTEIISYEWDFDSDGIYDYQETPDYAPDGTFDGMTTHPFGDNGVYEVNLRITDESNATDTDSCIVTVNNVDPIISPILPPHVYENSPITLTVEVLDPGSDDLTFIWNWGDGTQDTVTTYYNDVTGPEPVYDPTTNEIKSPWGTFPFNATDTVIHIYGDNGEYTVTLTVEDDDGDISIYETSITVSNVDPKVTIKSTIMDVEIGLRVAGRKYNNVSMTLYEDGNPIGHVSIERMPGSPNDQMAWIPVILNMIKTYNATVTYTPEDPPNIGGNPVWIYIKFKNGTVKKIHHTFNVQQSKKRDSDHWNHVEPWEVDLNAHLIGHAFEITSHITDPGSDDETLTYTYGSQTVTVTYLNNPPNPDPFPSPEVKPVNFVDITTLTYEGPGTITLVVEDDDNIRLGVGQGTDSFDVA